MYKVTWVRYRDENEDWSQIADIRDAKLYIAKCMNKDITDLRFNPISLLGTPSRQEYMVDYYGQIIACITREEKGKGRVPTKGRWRLFYNYEDEIPAGTRLCTPEDCEQCEDPDCGDIRCCLISEGQTIKDVAGKALQKGDKVKYLYVPTVQNQSKKLWFRGKVEKITPKSVKVVFVGNTPFKNNTVYVQSPQNKLVIIR